MPVSELGPPPEQGVVDQMQPQQGPFSMAQQRGQQQPEQQPEQDPAEAHMIAATISMKQMLNSKPALGPWVNQAINLLQTGVRTIMAQDRQQAGMTTPVASATPSSEPGGGLPV